MQLNPIKEYDITKSNSLIKIYNPKCALNKI